MQTSEDHSTMADMAAETKQVVSARADEVAEQGRNQLRSQVDQRSDQLADQVGAVAEALRSGAGELRSRGNSSHKVVERGADEADRLAGYLRRTDADQLLAQAESFGRRRPMLVTAAGLAAGFGIARMLKASSDARYQRAPSRPVQAGYRPEYGYQNVPRREGTPPATVTGRI
jgi:hypothetical protein